MWGKMTDNYNNTDQPKDSHDVLSPAADINNFFEDEFVNRVWNAAMCGTLSSATGLLFRSVVDSLKINLNELLDNAAGIYRAELVGVK